jgi:hypothetical protein
LNRVRLSIVTGILLSIFLMGTISWIHPSNDDLWVENPFWNGLSEFYSITNPIRLSQLTDLEVDNVTYSSLFLIGPSTEFTQEEADVIESYISRGGTLILLDDFGTGNQLLGILGLNARFTGQILRDPIFRDKHSLMPRVIVTNITGVNNIVLNVPSVLVLDAQAKILAYSSPTSYTTTIIEEYPDRFSQKPIIASLSLGRGSVVLIGDSSIFINSMINRGDNKVLLGRLARCSVIIDESHSKPSPLTGIKSVLLMLASSFQYLEVRYLMVLIIIAVIIIFSVTEIEEVDEVEKILRKYPEYDRNLLEKINNDRKAKI